MRKKVKGWDINRSAQKNKKRRELILEFDILHKFSETGHLTDQDKKRMKEINEELEQIWLKEEIAAKQQSEIEWFRREIEIQLTFKL